MDEQTVKHLTAADVSTRLRVPVWSIYELAKNGELPALRIGRRLRFRLGDIEEWERLNVQRGRPQT